MRDGNSDFTKLQAITGAIVANAQTQSALQRVSSSFRSMVPQFDVDVDRVTTSCGYAVPLMDLVGDRERLLDWARAKGDDGLTNYWKSKNAVSIDGIPGLGA